MDGGLTRASRHPAGPPAPPIAAWVPLAWWAVGALVLTAVVLGGVRGPGPLNDPDPADERTGRLTPPDEAVRVPGLELPGDPVGRRPVLLVFDRRAPDPDGYSGFIAEASRGTVPLLVVPHAPAAQRRAVRGRSAVLEDRPGSVAAAVGIDKPKDGGPPIGFALIDRRARVRHATLDPDYAEHGFEIMVLGGAIR